MLSFIKNFFKAISKSPSLEKGKLMLEEKEEERQLYVLPKDEIVEILLPQIEENVKGYSLENWLVKEGDIINHGDVLGEFSTDKATMEFESFYGGEIVFLHEKSESIPIETVVCKIKGI